MADGGSGISSKLQAWLDRAVALRAEMLQGEIRFFRFLVDGENGACPWKGQYTDFEQLLETTGLCSTQRYTTFRDALVALNGEVLSKIDTLGVDGVIEAARIQSANKRAEFIARIEESTKNQGCNLSARRIKEIGQQIAPKQRPKRRANDKSYDQLLKENKMLRAENERLKAENKKLKAEIKDLKSRK